MVVIYKDIPDTDFICAFDSEIRLRVSRVEKSKFFELSRKSLCAILDNCILVFEEIGNQIAPKEDVLKAVFWYRKWLGEKTMYILNTTD